ncbi:MAG: DNA-binding protein WhiA [Bacillota bacterium]
MATFSTKTKNELARLIPVNRCCRKAELTALILTDGDIWLDSKSEAALTLATENAAVARKIIMLGKTLFSLQSTILLQRNKRLKKKNQYIISIGRQPGVVEALAELGLPGEGVLSRRLPKPPRKNCCRRSYLRGIFLGAGSLNRPEGGNYHLEINLPDEDFCQAVCQLLLKFGLNPKVNYRKNRYVIYLKNSEEIVDLLNIIGAHAALLDFENARVIKQLRNKVNRLVNCETANLEKTVDTGMRQLESIKKIAQTIGLQSLPEGLREMAEVRLANPDASLKELGYMLSPAIGKSGVNHRLRRLEEIAQKIEGNKR